MYPSKFVSAEACSPGCTCIEFMDLRRQGQCQTASLRLYDSGFCYVDLPITCADAVESTTYPGRFYSAEACNPGCTCSDHAGPNGRGSRCKTRSTDHHNHYFCYVNLATTCSDVFKDSSTGTHSSASACSCAVAPLPGSDRLSCSAYRAPICQRCSVVPDARWRGGHCALLEDACVLQTSSISTKPYCLKLSKLATGENDLLATMNMLVNGGPLRVHGIEGQYEAYTEISDDNAIRYYSSDIRSIIAWNPRIVQWEGTFSFSTNHSIDFANTRCSTNCTDTKSGTNLIIIGGNDVGVTELHTTRRVRGRECTLTTLPARTCFEYGLDYSNGKVSKNWMKLNATQSPEDCQKLCAMQGKCKFWSFYTEEHSEAFAYSLNTSKTNANIPTLDHNSCLGPRLCAHPPCTRHVSGME